MGSAGRRTGGIDPRLLHLTTGTRRFLAATIVLGAMTAGLVVAQAWLIAHTVARVVVGHLGLADVRPLMALLLLVIGCRAAVAWIGERMAERASATAKSDLRTALVEHVARLGPDQGRTGSVFVLATTGIDALDGYFSRYLPQLFLAVIVPVTVTLVIGGTDVVAAVVIAATVPLIPVFMALIGASARGRVERQSQLLQRLAGHFLDTVAGLPTLKVFGRAKAQVRAIRDMTDRYRAATMDTLRVAFLSSLALELLATFSVAIVAVAVGLRLLGGGLTFSAALFVLILTPEAYLPLRRLGASYHASAEGLQAAEAVFAVLEQPVPSHGRSRDIPDPSRTGLRIEHLEVCFPGRALPAVDDVTLEVRPGEVLALTGPSGCGKSTLLSVLLRLVPATSGAVHVGERDLAVLDPDAWRRQVAWVPQQPHLFARSVADNIRLGRSDATDAQVAAALRVAGLDDVVARLPDGIDTVLGHDGAGLSAGERQRVALARAFVRDASLLLLDEPTANLDGRTEQEVLAAVRRVIAGRTVVLVAHRPSLLELADRVVELVPASVLS